MSNEKLIQLTELSKHYQVEISFFSDLEDIGVIEIYTIQDLRFIQEDQVRLVEKVIRMQKELQINLEGVDTVLNLLEKIHDLQIELNTVKNRLRLYEDDE